MFDPHKIVENTIKKQKHNFSFNKTSFDPADEYIHNSLGLKKGFQEYVNVSFFCKVVHNHQSKSNNSSNISLIDHVKGAKLTMTNSYQ